LVRKNDYDSICTFLDESRAMRCVMGRWRLKLLLEMIAESDPKAKNINVASLIDSSFVERLDRAGVLD